MFFAQCYLREGLLHNVDLASLMGEAIGEARKARLAGEVPVGAILVDQPLSIVTRAHNRCILDNDPTAHAEIVAIRQAAKLRRNYRLNGMALVVTIEPCPMCMAAIINARIDTLVFGASDHKSGAAGSVWNFAGEEIFNHRVQIIPGIMEMECRELIQNFFREKR